MIRAWRAVALWGLIAAGVAAAGCGGEDGGGDDAPAREDCAVVGDEDASGRADCADPACAAAPACQPAGGAVWIQRAYIKASNTGMYDDFGYSVALSADGVTLAVGASYEDSAATHVDGGQADNSAADAGAVYVRY